MAALVSLPAAANSTNGWKAELFPNFETRFVGHALTVYDLGGYACRRCLLCSRVGAASTMSLFQAASSLLVWRLLKDTRSTRRSRDLID